MPNQYKGPWTPTEITVFETMYGVVKNAVLIRLIKAVRGRKVMASSLSSIAPSLGIKATSKPGYYTLKEASDLIGLKKNILVNGRGAIKKLGIEVIGEEFYNYITEEDLVRLKEYYAKAPDTHMPLKEFTDRLGFSNSTICAQIINGTIPSYRTSIYHFIDKRIFEETQRYIEETGRVRMDWKLICERAGYLSQKKKMPTGGRHVNIMLSEKSFEYLKMRSAKTGRSKSLIVDEIIQKWMKK